MTMDAQWIEDAAAIRAVVDAWVLWRDTGDWDRLARCWHSGGTMSSTRFRGAAEDFVEQTRIAFERGANVQHFQCGFACDIVGTRAISQVRMQIRQRAWIDGIELDATCTGRFYDFFEKRDDRWAIVRRQPIYEVDRLDPVAHGQTPVLDAELLAQFPRSYRHLAYLQSKNGIAVVSDLPELRGPQVETLYADGRRWLAGDLLTPTNGSHQQGDKV